MKLRKFGGSGFEVPVIGQGTWQMERDGPAAIAALRRGLELGMTHVDTAEMYGSGAVERLVGEAIAGRRDEVFLASKVQPFNASRKGTVRACEASLRRLRTDRLDLYLLHWPGRHRLEETIAGFQELQAAGKILSFGLSNFDVEQLDQAIRMTGPGGIACDQVLYYLKQRGIEHELIPFCQDHDVALVGYSPFGQGDFEEDDPTLGQIAAVHGATAGQVALAFLVRLQGTFTIPKASALHHVEANAGAAELVLSADDIAALEQAFPLGERPGVLPTL